jgi:hypothetical protein
MWITTWMVYTGIRLSYAPERGPGFQVFTERLATYSKFGYEFSTVIDYAVAFFQKHQNSPPETWFDSDPDLHITHFGHAAQRAIAAVASRSVSPTKTTVPLGPRPFVPMNEQICHSFNRTTGCKVENCFRRHVCQKCRSDGHNALACKPTSK